MVGKLSVLAMLPPAVGIDFDVDVLCECGGRGEEESEGQQAHGDERTSTEGLEESRLGRRPKVFWRRTKIGVIFGGSFAMNLRYLLVLSVLLTAGKDVIVAQTVQPIPFATAQSYFLEAKGLCEADAGKLWGVSLCGPMMFIDPDSRDIVANQADAKGALVLRDGVYVGVLPKSENMANTSTEWSGTRWTEMVWPIPEDRSKRDTLMMHELFHRIQNEIRVPPIQRSDNPQLDTFDGRYTLLLEYRALAKALDAGTEAERRAAIEDALVFRAERYRVFPKAAPDEAILELNEGLAEYTGVRLGNPEAGEAKAAALRDLVTQAKVPTLVRSFAYGTGPAYGLLLDRYDPQWRTKLDHGEDSPQLLQSAMKIVIPEDTQKAVQGRSAKYDGAALRATETEREVKRQAQLAMNRARFVEGHTLSLPLKEMGVQFDPRTLQPMDDLGTVYPEIRVTDAWGILEAPKGALINKDWTAVIVTAPTDVSGGNLKGDGWTLEMKPGWKLVAGPRTGDFVLQFSK